MRKRIVTVLTIIVFVLILIVIIAASGLIRRYMPSDELSDLNEYFGAPTGDQAGLIVDHEVTGANALVIDGTVYIEYEIVKDYINDRFYWDSNENILLYTLPTDIVSANIGETGYSVSATKENTSYVVVKAEGAQTYIAADFVQKYSDMDYQVYEDPDRVTVTTRTGVIDTAQAKNSTQVREKGGIKSPIVKELAKKDKVYILEEGEKWSKVATEDGFVGYVQVDKLSSYATETREANYTEPEYTNISRDYTINLAWHQVTSQAANDEIVNTLLTTKGLNVISPTWFSISDNDGNITSLASQTYVNYCNQANIEVWGLVDNFDENINIHEVLSYTSRRENLINQLIGKALEYGLDGINVDFEDVPAETGDSYIQFIRELSVKCRNNGIILSVDNYVPQNYNSHYHLKEQGVFADYVIIMGYDEHYSGSLESGSVASIDYVTNGIERALQEVPAEKLINGVPFYTRLWKETPKSGDEISAQDGTEEGEYLVNVEVDKTLGMNGAEAEVAAAEDKYGIERTWDSETAQYYLEYEEDGATYKIWMEEEESIEEKLKVIKEHDLAGVAAWKLGFEKSSIWDIILKYIN